MLGLQCEPPDTVSSPLSLTLIGALESDGSDAGLCQLGAVEDIYLTGLLQSSVQHGGSSTNKLLTLFFLRPRVVEYTQLIKGSY